MPLPLRRRLRGSPSVAVAKAAEPVAKPAELAGGARRGAAPAGGHASMVRGQDALSEGDLDGELDDELPDANDELPGAAATTLPLVAAGVGGPGPQSLHDAGSSSGGAGTDMSSPPRDVKLMRKQKHGLERAQIVQRCPAREQ